jgi:hypothetical protein
MYDMKIKNTGLFLFLFVAFGSVNGFSQSGITISSGSSILINSATVFSVDSLVLIPSADFTLSGMNAESRNTVITHPAIGAYIKRVFHLASTIPSFSGAITFYYMDGELNGIPEAALTLNIQNGILWKDYPLNVTRDGVNNFVTTTGLTNININELTLASISEPLPVLFGRISTLCDNGDLEISWTTEQESNSKTFFIERNSAVTDWEIAGSQAAAGNSESQRSYRYKVMKSPENSFYRIVESDLDGRQFVSVTIPSSCSSSDNFQVYPNPATVMVYLSLYSTEATAADLSLYDAKGSRVKQFHRSLTKGNNLIPFDIRGLVPGNYILHADWGTNSRTSKLFLR